MFFPDCLRCTDQPGAAKLRGSLYPKSRCTSKADIGTWQNLVMVSDWKTWFIQDSDRSKCAQASWPFEPCSEHIDNNWDFQTEKNRENHRLPVVPCPNQGGLVHARTPMQDMVQPGSFLPTQLNLGSLSKIVTFLQKVPNRFCPN